jgi:hypothetical protein
MKRRAVDTRSHSTGFASRGPGKDLAVNALSLLAFWNRKCNQQCCGSRSVPIGNVLVSHIVETWMSNADNSLFARCVCSQSRRVEM